MGGFELTGAAAAAAYERLCELTIALGTTMRCGPAARVARRIARLENMMKVVN